MTPAKQAPRYAVYVRLSRETRGSVSLADQEARCRAFVASQAGVVAAVYGDTASGASTNGRQEFLRMVEDARAKPRRFDRIVSLRVDRLGRSVLDLASLADVARKHGVAIQTVEGGIDSSTPTGQLVFDVLAAVAAMERELIRSRTKDSLERRRALGLRWSGNLAYAFRVEQGRVVLDPTRVPVIREIFERRAKGESLSSIARTLNSKATKGHDEYRPAKVREWNPDSPEVVASILRNVEAYRAWIPDLRDLPVVGEALALYTAQFVIGGKIREMQFEAANDGEAERKAEERANTFNKATEHRLGSDRMEILDILDSRGKSLKRREVKP